MATEDAAEADRLIEEYPWLEEIYREAAALRKNPEEVLGMYSEALRILDRNTVRYMIEEQKKEIEQQKKEIDQQKAVIEERDRQIQEKDSLLEQQYQENAELKRQLKELLEKRDV